jgi:hypothetical protein
MSRPRQQRLAHARASAPPVNGGAKSFLPAVLFVPDCSSVVSAHMRIGIALLLVVETTRHVITPVHRDWFLSRGCEFAAENEDARTQGTVQCRSVFFLVNLRIFSVPTTRSKAVASGVQQAWHMIGRTKGTVELKSVPREHLF